MARCPYCAEREADTADHIFAAFLGGGLTVPACKLCNNSTFGSGIEAKTFESLSRMMFLLRLCGMPPSKPMVWKKIPLGDDGQLYDVDQDLRAEPSTPTMIRDAAGNVIGARGARGHVVRHQRSLKQDGKDSRIVEEGPTTIHPTRISMRFPADEHCMRVCLKMSVAVAARFGMENVLGTEARGFLLTGGALDPGPVRMDVNLYPELDRLRPRAGHLVYVRASSAERRAYSVVQLFSAFQFYCELATNYDGAERSVVATHDPLSHEERLTEIAPLELIVPLRHLGGTPAEANRLRFEQLTREVRVLYGDDATTGFWPDP